MTAHLFSVFFRLSQQVYYYNIVPGGTPLVLTPPFPRVLPPVPTRESRQASEKQGEGQRSPPCGDVVVRNPWRWPLLGLSQGIGMGVSINGVPVGDGVVITTYILGFYASMG